MLGGIVASVFMLAPFVTLILAAAILAGIVTMAVAGRSLTSKEVALSIPEAKKVS